MDCSLPGSSVCGIFQARILEWVAISYSTGSSRPRDRNCVSCVSCLANGFFFTTVPPGKSLLSFWHAALHRWGEKFQNADACIGKHKHIINFILFWLKWNYWVRWSQSRTPWMRACGLRCEGKENTCWNLPIHFNLLCLKWGTRMWTFEFIIIFGNGTVSITCEYICYNSSINTCFLESTGHRRMET